MRYFVNGRYSIQQTTGVQRVANEIFNNNNDKYFEIVVPPKYFSNGFMGYVWDQLILPIIIIIRSRAEKYILLSMTNTGPLLVKNQILFIHDLSIFDQGDSFSFSYKLVNKVLLPLLSKRVNKIITCSNFSKKRIINLLGIHEKKIHVLYLGSSFNDSYEGPPPKNKIIESLVETKYIMTLGSLDPRKNLSLILNAWKEIKNLDNYKLVVIGKKNNIFNHEVDIKNTDDVIFTGYLSDDEIHWLYSNTELFISASRYEGFNLPPLEALSCKSKILLSDIDVHNEIYGDHSYFFKNDCIESLLSNILNIIPRKEIKNSHMLDKFLYNMSWKNTQKNFLKIIK